MSEKKGLKELFNEWDSLNTDVGASFQGLDFSGIKEIRKKQRIVEDSIYEILKKVAPSEIKEILPDNCGEMEMGLEKGNDTFYFLMEDPAFVDVEELQILAITIDINQNIEKIKNFQRNDA